MSVAGLTIALCTRNRPDDLRRAIDSVLACAGELDGVAVELLVVDDGRLGEAWLADTARAAASAGWRFAYHNKRVRAGLMRSRVEAVACAAGDVILFLDDDLEVEHGYLATLVRTYLANPELAGVGGVDVLSRPAPLWRRAYEVAIGYRSPRQGKQSISGFGGGMDQWATRTAPFHVDFLYGCNMSFRRDAIRELDAPAFFSDYSLGEDHYISAVASRSGPLLAEPRMRVRHHQSPISRDRAEQVFYTQLVNHFHLLRALDAPLSRRLALVVTAAGLFFMFAVKWLIDLTTPGRNPETARLRGSGRGLLFILERAGSFRLSRASRRMFR